MNSISFNSALGLIFSSKIRNDISLDDSVILLKSLFQVLSNNPFLAFASRRQITFLNWRGSSHVARQALQSGFYHTESDDETVCVGCGLGLKQWSSSDCVEVQHFSMSPQCAFLMARSVLCEKTAAITGRMHSEEEPDWEGFCTIFAYLKEGLMGAESVRSSSSSQSSQHNVDLVKDFDRKEAADTIQNALGLGHGAAIITLGTFRHFYQLSNRCLPANTVELLRAILQIEEKLEESVSNQSEPRAAQDAETAELQSSIPPTQYTRQQNGRRHADVPNVSTRRRVLADMRSLESELPPIHSYLAILMRRRQMFEDRTSLSENVPGVHTLIRSDYTNPSSRVS